MPRGVNRFDEARLQGRLWTPDIYRGENALWSWHDAQALETVTIDGSGNVSDWRDRSGNARHTAQATSGLRPIWANDIFSGRPAMKGGSGGTMRQLTSTVTPSLAQPFTVYLVTKINGALNNFACAWNGAQSGSSTAHLALRRSDQSNNPSIWAGSALKGFSSPLSVGSSYIIGAVFNGASALGLNGAEFSLGGSAGGSGISSGFCLCGSTPATMESDAYFGEFVVIAKACGTRENQRNMASLAWKWGVVDSLASSNPYKNRPPLIGD